jgi:hypothetical protein
MTIRTTTDNFQKTVVGDLYERWTLDIVTSLGRPCALILQDHPQEFRLVPQSIVKSLATFRYQTGYDAGVLSDNQRLALVSPLLGASDGAAQPNRSGAFHHAATAVRERARDFVQRVFDTGEAQLRDAFRDALSTLQKYLTSVSGAVYDDANRRVSTQFELVVAVLQTQQYAAGVGLPPAPKSPWPLNLAIDGNGAFLVHVIAERAGPDSGVPFTPTDEEFLQIQRIASYGAATIDRVLTDPSILTNADTANDAIGLAYRWWTSICERAGLPTSNRGVSMS